MPGRLAVLRSRAGPAGRKSLLVGSGTSRHAAEIAAAWFREAGLSASVSPAGEIHGPLRDHVPVPRGVMSIPVSSHPARVRARASRSRRSTVRP